MEPDTSENISPKTKRKPLLVDHKTHKKYQDMLNMKSLSKNIKYYILENKNTTADNSCVSNLHSMVPALCLSFISVNQLIL